MQIVPKLYLLYIIPFKIESRKLDWNAKSKIGSMKNAKYVAGGGDIKVS